MARKILLFGGTFDPVHNGHLIVARCVAERCGFERVTLVPAASPPHKDTARASGADRLEMLRRAVAGDPLFEICDLELHRSGASYTFDTLTAVRGRNDGEVSLYWLIGADMLEQLHTWSRASEVVDMAGIITAMRSPWDRRVPAILEALRGRFRPEQVRRLEDAIVATPLIDISSTEIRGRVRQGSPIRYLVPEGVRAYIRAEKLYQAAAQTHNG